MPNTSTERVAISWVVAGLALLMLVGISFSIEDPAPRTSESPTYAIDEDLQPLQTGAVEEDHLYTEFV